MKRKIITALLSIAVFSMCAYSVYASTANDWRFTLRNSSNTADVAKDLQLPGDTNGRLLGMHASGTEPDWFNLGQGLIFDIGTLRLQDIHFDKVLGLQDALDAKANTADVNSSIGNVNGSIDVLFNLTPFAFDNGTAIYGEKWLFFNGTTTSGAKTFYLTDDGTSTGNPMCNAVDHVNITANDPSNTFGLGYSVTNSNKNLTLSLNTRSFASTTILGISVLGSSSLTAAPNGTAVSALVLCR